MRRWGIIPPLSLFMIFPLTYSLGKMGFSYGPQILFVALRMFISGAIVLGIHAFIGTSQKKFSGQSLKLFISTTFFGIGSYIPEFWALKYVSVAKIALIFLTIPFFSALFEWMHGMEKITSRKILGMVIGFLGMIPVSISSSPEGINCLNHISITFPELMVFCAAGMYAYGWISFKELTKNHGYDSIYINGMRMFYGAVLALVSSFFLEQWCGFVPVVIDWTLFSWYAFLISLVGVTCFVFYGILLNYYSATLIAFTGFVEPFFAILYAWILLGETVSLTMLLSLCVVSFGLFLFFQEEKRLTDLQQ